MSQTNISHGFTEEMLNDLGNQIIAECWLLSFQAILDTFEPTEALEIIKPHMHTHGVIGSHVFHRDFHIKGNDLADVAMAIQITLDWHEIAYKNTEIKRDSAYFEIVSCPYFEAPKEFCTSWCGYGFGGVTKGFNSQCEFIIDSSLANGDKCCRFRVVKVKEQSADSETLAVLIRPRMQRGVINYWNNAHQGELWTIYPNALVEHAGKEKTIEIMKPYMQQNGMSFALGICQRFNLTGKNADTIGFIINLSNEALLQRGRVLISSPELFEKEINECPFSNSSHQICPDLLVMRSTGICEAINSDFEIVPKSRMCRGDKTCHWIIKKKPLKYDLKKVTDH